MEYDHPAMPPEPEKQMFQHAAPPAAPRKKIGVWSVLSTIMLFFSILVNGVLLVTVIAMGAIMTTSATSRTTETILEKTLIDGNRNQKIAAIRIEGVIDSRMSDWVAMQLDAARCDTTVKGVIIRINSPGGDVAASDQIHYAISRYKERTGKPVLAFMQSVAASGGYYSAVACDQIMAEPTTITGSIGVIMSHLVVKDLLEEKLGINPVVIKSGERKDWPSLYSETTDEQRQYLDERIIQPAYERFVQLVAEGRKGRLTEAEVRVLADGGIFTAPDALTSKLIDQIGYFEQAVESLAQKAGLTRPLVVEYSERFSVLSIFGAEANRGLTLDADLLEKLLIPKLMYLWDGRR